MSDAGQGWPVSQTKTLVMGWWVSQGGALRVWPTIDQDVIHECTQRKEREWWEGDKHIAVMAMTEVLCLTWLSIWT